MKNDATLAAEAREKKEREAITAKNKLFHMEHVAPAAEAIRKYLAPLSMKIMSDIDSPSHGSTNIKVEIMHPHSTKTMALSIYLSSKQRAHYPYQNTYKLGIKVDPDRYRFGRLWADGMGTRNYTTSAKAIPRLTEVIERMQACMDSQLSTDQDASTRDHLTKKEIGTLADHPCVTKVQRKGTGAIDKADYTLHLNNLPGFLAIKILEIINS